MDDHWNLSLDQSVLEDWSREKKILIGDQDITSILTCLNSLNARNISSTQIADLEDQITICLSKGGYNSQETESVLQLVYTISLKLEFLSTSMCELTTKICKSMIRNVLELKSSTDVREYFVCLKHCVLHLKENNNLNSLKTIFEIIEQVYNECLNNSLNVTDELFKQTTGVLMIALPIVEHQNSHNIEEVCSLLRPLIEVGKLSCKLDVKSMALIWKLVLKALQSNSKMCSHLDLGNVVIFIANELSYLFDTLSRTTDCNVSKLVKVIGFLLKVLIGLIEIERDLLERDRENETVLNLLVLHLIRFSPDMITHGIGITESYDLIRLLEVHVSVTVHPILENLVRTQRFLPTLMKISSSCSNNRLNLMRLLGVLFTTTYQSVVEENRRGSLKSDLLSILLRVVDQANNELNRTVILSGIINNHDRNFVVPVYELMVSQISTGLMAIESHKFLNQCLAILLESFIKHGFWAHLMACDLLTAVARSSSSQFCLELTQYLLLLSPPTATLFCRTVQLLSRLIRFLSPADRSIVLKECITMNSDIWASTKWCSFALDQQREFFLSSPLLTSCPDLVKAHDILRLDSLTITGNNCRSLQGENFIQNYIRVGMLLMNGLNSSSTKQYRRHIEHLLSCVLRILLSTVHSSQKDEHLYLMQILKMAIDSKPSILVHFSSSEFLYKLGSTSVCSSPQQPALLRVITSLFCELIGSQSFLVQECTLCTFENFLRTTAHLQLSSSMRQNNESKIEHFLNRKHTQAIPQDVICSFLTFQCEYLSNVLDFVKAFPKTPIESRSVPTNVESCNSLDLQHTTRSFAKRPRLENDEQLVHHISILAKSVSDISQLHPFPPWFKIRVQEQIDILKTHL